jgi:hypothetical protein
MAGAERGADALLEARCPTYSHTYTPRDVCLYALGVGAGAADLRRAAGRAAGRARAGTPAGVPPPPRPALTP